MGASDTTSETSVGTCGKRAAPAPVWARDPAVAGAAAPGAAGAAAGGAAPAAAATASGLAAVRGVSMRRASCKRRAAASGLVSNSVPVNARRSLGPTRWPLENR